MDTKTRTCIIFAAVLLTAAVDLLSGGGGLSVPDAAVFLKLRLPRMLTALLCGASLSLAGLQMQSIFRNPLADPHIMGISAGAGTGAAVATLAIGSALPSVLSSLTVASAAFLGALLSCVLVTAVASRFHDVSTLLIFGVMMGFVFSAVTSILEYSADAENLKVFYSWSAGSFIGNRPGEVAAIGAALVVGTILSLLNARRLDVALFGDEYSAMVGADPSRTRLVSLAGSCLMTGTVTAFCGPLGFVGIVAPHISRAFLQTSLHSKVIPASILTGAFLSLIADMLSQILPSPLPVGSTMALIGIPVILYILFKSRHA